MNDAKCYYHSQDNAIEKCKTCGKPLCEELARNTGTYVVCHLLQEINFKLDFS